MLSHQDDYRAGKDLPWQVGLGQAGRWKTDMVIDSIQFPISNLEVTLHLSIPLVEPVHFPCLFYVQSVSVSYSYSFFSILPVPALVHLEHFNSFSSSHSALPKRPECFVLARDAPITHVCSVPDSSSVCGGWGRGGSEGDDRGGSGGEDREGRETDGGREDRETVVGGGRESLS